MYIEVISKWRQQRIEFQLFTLSHICTQEHIDTKTSTLIIFLGPINPTMQLLCNKYIDINNE